jgi:hypothetical protein
MSAESSRSANKPGADGRDAPGVPGANTGANREQTAGATDNRVFVKIPQAGPGQSYKAPKNYDHPLLNLVSRLATLAICLAIPLIPGVIVGMIMFLPLPGGAHNALQAGFAWLWIPMFLFVEAFAVFLAVNVYREAVGSAGEDTYRRAR